MSTPAVIILAAGLGSRLGRSEPKPLTQIDAGNSILQQQIANCLQAFGPQCSITIVVGYKAELILEHVPDVLFAYNPLFDRTNTAKSLLCALRHVKEGPVIWMNGDVVFDHSILSRLVEASAGGLSCVAVNRSQVGDEEVKYSIDAQGFIRELSKAVVDPLGEAVGVNLVSANDRSLLLEQLEAVGPQDYFERAIELGIAAGMRVLPLAIDDAFAMEIDFDSDLQAVLRHLAERLQEDHHR